MACTLLLLVLLAFASVFHSKRVDLASHTLSIDSHSPALLAHIISNQMREHGMIFIDNSSTGHSVSINGSSHEISGLESLSQVVANISVFYHRHQPPAPASANFTYTLGNVAGRSEVAKGLHKVSGAPQHVLVTAHSEASYLSVCPELLVFACPGVPDLQLGGQTTVYKIDDIEAQLLATPLGRNLLDEVAQHGVVYLRNDVSGDNAQYAHVWRAAGYPAWQTRFDGMQAPQIEALLARNGQKASWHGATLRSEWTAPGFRLHPETGQRVWFNQLYGMNGRYFDGHQVEGMAAIPFAQRPLHSRLGNGRELSDAEYALLDGVHAELAMLVPWDHAGDILALDNFAFQHGTYT